MGCILNLNNVILVGRLTKTPELRMTSETTPVTEFTIAVNRPRYQSNEQQTDFINCVAWRETAEFITKRFSKGNSICVQGRIQTRSRIDKDGNKRYVTDVLVTNASCTEKRTVTDPSEHSDLNTTKSANNEETAADDLPF